MEQHTKLNCKMSYKHAMEFIDEKSIQTIDKAIQEGDRDIIVDILNVSSKQFEEAVKRRASRYGIPGVIVKSEGEDETRSEFKQMLKDIIEDGDKFVDDFTQIQDQMKERVKKVEVDFKKQIREREEQRELEERERLTRKIDNEQHTLGELIEMVNNFDIPNNQIFTPDLSIDTIIKLVSFIKRGDFAISRITGIKGKDAFLTHVSNARIEYAKKKGITLPPDTTERRNQRLDEIAKGSNYTIDQLIGRFYDPDLRFTDAIPTSIQKEYLYLLYEYVKYKTLLGNISGGTKENILKLLISLRGAMMSKIAWKPEDVPDLGAEPAMAVAVPVKPERNPRLDEEVDGYTFETLADRFKDTRLPFDEAILKKAPREFLIALHEYIKYGTFSGMGGGINTDTLLPSLRNLHKEMRAPEEQVRQSDGICPAIKKDGTRCTNKGKSEYGGYCGIHKSKA